MKTAQWTVLLAPTDMSDASAPAVACAIDLGRRLGAQVVLFHVISSKDVDRGVAEGRFLDQQLADVCSQLADWYGAAIPAADREGVRVQMAAGIGVPDEEILRRATALQAAMVVMATHGRTGLKRGVFGSVAEAVLRHANCPVLTIRTTAKIDAEPFPVPKTESGAVS